MGLAGPLAGEPSAQGGLDGAVGLGNGRQVGLRLDAEISGAESSQRDRVGVVGEGEGELEVGAHRPRA
jgi:hypothetical protein